MSNIKLVCILSVKKIKVEVAGMPYILLTEGQNVAKQKKEDCKNRFF